MIELIFHIAMEADWKKAKSHDEYTVDSLKKEGFIHASTRSQVIPVANAFFKGKTELVLLEIDPKKLKNKVVYEEPMPKLSFFGNDEKFPHIYGPINRDAVVMARKLTTNSAGDFQFLDSKVNTDVETEIDYLKRNSKAAEVSQRPRLLIRNEYYRQGLAGTQQKVFLRSGVLTRLLMALEELPKEYGFVIFEAFRSVAAQRAIWDQMYAEVKRRNPQLSDTEVYQETRKFAANPSEKSRFEVPPHNSGGAIDIGLTDQNGKILDMGTEFDAIDEKSATQFFSQFSTPAGKKYQERRNILLNAMNRAGFTNYPDEWWHFDLGSCAWTQELKTKWFYPSMEPLLGIRSNERKQKKQ